MQVFARCGADIGTLVVHVAPADTFAALKDQLVDRFPCLSPPEQLLVVYGGRPCRDHWTLSKAGVGPESTLQVLARLCGGGGDGGSTGAESRSSYLEMYMGKKPDKVNPAEERLARFTRCQLSGETLQPPVVCDELGRLYNKDAVVQALVSKSLPKPLQYISGLKSLISLKLERNSRESKSDAVRGMDQAQLEADSEFCCPITGQEFNGRFRFVALRNTGHVISERALKQVPAAVEEHIGQKWAADDVIPINGTPEEVEELTQRMLSRRAAAKVIKKDKKSKSGSAISISAAAATTAGDSNGHLTEAPAVPATDGHAPAHKAGGKPPSGKRALPEGLTAQAAANGKKFKATDVMPTHASASVYASIFTSSRVGEEIETYGCRSLSSRGMRPC